MPYYSAITNPVYKPAVRDISAITQSLPATVTTSFEHSYLTGLIIRLYIPFDYGMQQINGFQGTITVTSSTEFTIDVDSTFFDAFVIPTETPPQPLGQVAQVVPIGEDASILTQSLVNVLTPQF